MPMISVDQVKARLHIDGIDDDANLNALIDAAEDWLKSVGVAEEDLSRPSIQQAAVLMVKHWFDAGISVETDGASAGTAYPPAVRALIAPWRKVLV